VPLQKRLYFGGGVHEVSFLILSLFFAFHPGAMALGWPQVASPVNIHCPLDQKAELGFKKNRDVTKNVILASHDFVIKIVEQLLRNVIEEN
jgi:hypothetical protein